MIIWITGLSGAGKTTIGENLTTALRDLGKPTMFLDGDSFRSIFGEDLGHSIKDRRVNARRLARFSAYASHQKINLVIGVLLLFDEIRRWNRENIEDFFEVYLSVTLTTVRRRDPKQLYEKFSRGEIKDLAGLDLDFTEPSDADITIENNKDRVSVDGITNQIIQQLGNDGFLDSPY
tara:strand:- start:136 stop:666 length:531 start_codon:yes stop_codon:yes gene_type:complete